MKHFTLKKWISGTVILSAFFWILISPRSLGADKAPLKSKEELSKKGKAIYMSNCIACHNSNPQKNGSLGPAVAGASMELLMARVVEAKYPAGYTPKRKTKLMKPLPKLKDSLPAIHAFLNP